MPPTGARAPIEFMTENITGFDLVAAVRTVGSVQRILDRLAAAALIGGRGLGGDALVR